MGTTDWAAAQSLAGLAIAFAAAPLGAVADQGGYRRAMLAVATALMVAFTAALWFVRPEPGDAVLALGCVGASTLAFGIATV
ncbi:MAG: MFS transporter, partial [Acetobacteraceae bacterium]